MSGGADMSQGQSAPAARNRQTTPHEPPHAPTRTWLPTMNAHAKRDEERLQLHRVIARMLLEDPERVLSIARDNLRRWRLQDPDAPYYEEWDQLLRGSGAAELAELLVADSEDARRLRQSTPFVGVVPQEERDRIVGRR